MASGWLQALSVSMRHQGLNRSAAFRVIVALQLIGRTPNSSPGDRTIGSDSDIVHLVSQIAELDAVDAAWGGPSHSGATILTCSTRTPAVVYYPRKCAFIMCRARMAARWHNAWARLPCNDGSEIGMTSIHAVRRPDLRG